MHAIHTIDADSHVYEVDETWDYLPEPYRARRPITITVEPERAPYMGLDNAFWFIDGRAIQWTMGHGAVQLGTPLTSRFAQMKAFPVGSQSLMDVPARLANLDAAGIDLQVIYPSIFALPLSEDDGFQTALTQSYHDWIAARCSLAPDRLKWVGVLPLRQPEAAPGEIARVKAMGAVGLMSDGTVGHEMLHAPRFDRVWAAASEAGLPVCVHAGFSYPQLRHTCDDHHSLVNLSFTLPLLIGFFSFTGGGILERHPELRVAFLEGGAGWLPWLMDRVGHYQAVNNLITQSFGVAPTSTVPPSAFKDRIYVTCEADEPLLAPAIDYLGEDNIMAAEDMPHLEERDGTIAGFSHHAAISEQTRRKILFDNPNRFYRLGLEAVDRAAE